MPDYSSVRVSQESMLEDGTVVDMMRVQFRAGGQGPFVVRVKKTPGWEDQAKAKMQAQCDELRALGVVFE